MGSRGDLHLGSARPARRSDVVDVGLERLTSSLVVVDETLRAPIEWSGQQLPYDKDT